MSKPSIPVDLARGVMYIDITFRETKRKAERICLNGGWQIEQNGFAWFDMVYDDLDSPHAYVRRRWIPTQDIKEIVSDLILPPAQPAISPEQKAAADQQPVKIDLADFGKQLSEHVGPVSVETAQAILNIIQEGKRIEDERLAKGLPVDVNGSGAPTPPPVQ